MKPGLARWVALLCLCLYGTAVGHTVLTHHDCHEADGSCVLCLVAHAPVLAVAMVLLVLYQQSAATPVLPVGDVPQLALCRSLCLRGPPSTNVRPE